MRIKEKPPAAGPGVNASASQPQPFPFSANLPDWLLKPASPSTGTPPSWRSPVAGARHENATVLRLRTGGVARRNGSVAVA